METSTMLCSCSQTKLTPSFAPVSSHCDARYSSLNPDVGFLFNLGRSRIARSGRSIVCVSSRCSDVKLVDVGGATCLRQRYEESRFGRRPERRSGRDRGRIAAAGEGSMWITAANAVALVVALALFAGFGGFLLSMAVENEAREEVYGMTAFKLGFYCLASLLELCVPMPFTENFSHLNQSTQRAHENNPDISRSYQAEEVEMLKEQGLYKEPEPTEYESQGVGTRSRNRRIRKE